MKKLFLNLLCAATLGLTGCGLEQSMSAAQIKSNLESKGYTAEVMGKAEAEGRISGIKWVVEISDAVYTSKGEHDVLIAFVCKNIDDASKFIQENIQAMNNFAERYTDNAQVGSHNNVAYAGAYDATAAAGIPARK